MSALPLEDYIPFDDLVTEVSNILLRRLQSEHGGADILKLIQLKLLTVDEAAEFLRVKRKTVLTWISRGVIPVRYVNTEPRFLLSELLAWTLPDDDPHARYRLKVSASCTISQNRLAAVKEKKNAGF
jgi:excisionase family DNA binding protein